MNIKQKGGADYSGDTESSRATRNIGKGRKGKKKQKGRVLDISGSQRGEDFTKKQKRSTKRIIRKSNRMYRAEERQEKRETRTGSKEGTGILGKVRKKFIDASKKRRSKGIDKNLDKLTFKQAFNTGRRYTPGKTFNWKGKEYNERLRKRKQKDTPGGVAQKGGEKKEVDYNKALSALGLIPVIGNIAKVAKKTKKKKSKKQMGGTFNTGQGSFVEPGMEEI